MSSDNSIIGVGLGRKFKANGIVWRSIRYLYDGYHLAVKTSDKMPRPVYVVKARVTKAMKIDDDFIKG